MTTPPGSALPMDPRILRESLARLRSGTLTGVLRSGAGTPVLASRAADPQFRRPVPAPVMLASPGVRATRPVLVPANLAALAGRLHRTADPTPDLAPEPATGIGG